MEDLLAFFLFKCFCEFQWFEGSSDIDIGSQYFEFVNEEEEDVIHEDVQINPFQKKSPNIKLSEKDAYSDIVDCIKNIMDMNVNMILAIESRLVNFEDSIQISH